MFGNRPETARDPARSQILFRMDALQGFIAIELPLRLW
jgi:hypothetical protein